MIRSCRWYWNKNIQSINHLPLFRLHACRSIRKHKSKAANCCERVHTNRVSIWNQSDSRETIASRNFDLRFFVRFVRSVWNDQFSSQSISIFFSYIELKSMKLQTKSIFRLNPRQWIFNGQSSVAVDIDSSKANRREAQKSLFLMFRFAERTSRQWI